MKDYQIADGVMLSDIHPSKGTKYSPNLHKWVRRRFYDVKRWGEICTIVRDKSGVLCYMEEFADPHIGTLRLFYPVMGSLCWDGKGEPHEEPWRLPVTPVPDFWQRYKAVGRCAIDPEHKVSFLNDEERWEVSEDGKTRKCRWCVEHTQRLEEYMEPRTRWVPIEVTP